MRTITRRLRLYPQQGAFLRSPKVYRAFVGGISTGKSWVGAYDLIRRAKRGRTYMVIGPTYTSLRDSSLKSFLALARDLGAIDPRHLKLAAPPELRLNCGATVLFRSADNPELLRGPNLSGVWLDEASLMPKLAYEVGIGRLRECGEQGWLSATFTPKGPSHWTYETFTAKSRDVELVRARTADNPFNPRGYAATLRRNYTEAFARQELDGEFVAVAGALFPPEWFDFPSFWCDEWPDGIGRHVLYLDPSQGRDSTAHDYQAYVRAGLWPGKKRENLIYLDCHAFKEPPSDMVARGVRLCRERRPDVWGYEVNGTMGLLAAEVERQLRAAEVSVLTVPVTHTAQEPKRWRVRSALMRYLSHRQIRIRDTPGGRLLRAQLGDEPFAEHDDCSDAAAGAVDLLGDLLA